MRHLINCESPRSKGQWWRSANIINVSTVFLELRLFCDRTCAQNEWNKPTQTGDSNYRPVVISHLRLVVRRTWLRWWYWSFHNWNKDGRRTVNFGGWMIYLVSPRSRRQGHSTPWQQKRHSRVIKSFQHQAWFHNTYINLRLAETAALADFGLEVQFCSKFT